MAKSAAEYEIQIRATGQTEAERLASSLDALTAGLTGAGAAATQAAQGVAAASASYKQAEVAAGKAAAAAEQNAARTLAAEAAMTKAALGTADGYDRALAKIASLKGAQAGLDEAARAAAAALTAEAAAVDAASASASAAVESHSALAAVLARAKEDAAGAESDAAAGANLRASEAAYTRATREQELADQLRAGQAAVSAANQAHSESEAAFQAAADAAAQETSALIASEQAFYNDSAAADALATAQLAAAESAYVQAEGERKLAEQLTASESAAASATKEAEKRKKTQADASAALKKHGDAQRNANQQAAAGAKVAFGIVGAIIAVAVAFIAGTAAIAAWGLELADANRTAKLGAEDELSLAKQSKQLKKNLSETFGGLKIEAFLGTLAKVIGLFDASSRTGAFMKDVFEGLFQPLIDAAAASFPVIERFFLEVGIAALKLYISFKPALKALDEFAGKKLTLDDALLAASVAARIVVTAIAAVIAVVGLVVGSFVLMYEAIGVAVGFAWSLGAAITGAVGSAMDYLRGTDLKQIGLDMITGLANGITAGAAAVLSAITGVVGSGIAAAKALLQQHSPSRVFAAIGENTSLGYAEGVEDGAPDAQTAMETMVSPPSPSRLAAIGGGASGGGARGGSVSLTGPFNFYGVAGAEDAVGMFEAMLNRTLAGDAVALGAGEVAHA